MGRRRKPAVGKSLIVGKWVVEDSGFEDMDGRN